MESVHIQQLLVRLPPQARLPPLVKPQHPLKVSQAIVLVNLK